MSASHSHKVEGMSASGMRTITNQASFWATGSARNASNSAAISCAWVRTTNPSASTKSTALPTMNLLIQCLTHPTETQPFWYDRTAPRTSARMHKRPPSMHPPVSRYSASHARNTRVMIALRYIGLALPVLAVLLLAAGGHPARGEERAPPAAPAE